MTTFADLDNITANLTPDQILGHLTSFTIRDGIYNLAALKAAYLAQGLKADLLPRPDTPQNAFIKACKAIDGWTYTMPGTDVEVTILVREIKYVQGNGGDRKIEYVFVREIPDKNRGQLPDLAHKTIGRAIFYKVGVGGSTAADVKREAGALVPGEEVFFSEIRNKVNEMYQAQQNNVDEMKIRQMVREYLWPELNGTRIGGGVYFVHNGRTAELERLQHLIRGLRPFIKRSRPNQRGHATLGTCSFNLLRVPNMPEERAFVAEQFEALAIEDIQSINRELAKLREDGKVNLTTLATIKKKYDAAIARAAEYTESLNVTLDEVAAEHESAVRHWKNLMNAAARGEN